jgi:transcriptional regulator with XRE-family HTH domain
MATVTDEAAKRVLAANIQARLMACGMSQRALSRETGDPHMTINGVVRGQHMPGAGLLTRIADALDTTVEALLQPTRKKTQKSA